jgi:hypothetical protein
MLKSPMARGQLDQMAKGMGMSGDTMIRVLEFLVSCAYAIKKVKNFVMHPVIKTALIVLVVSYILKWLGFTSSLLFMLPFNRSERDDE